MWRCAKTNYFVPELVWTSEKKLFLFYAKIDFSEKVCSAILTIAQQLGGLQNSETAHSTQNSMRYPAVFTKSRYREPSLRKSTLKFEIAFSRPGSVQQKNYQNFGKAGSPLISVLNDAWHV